MITTIIKALDFLFPGLCVCGMCSQHSLEMHAGPKDYVHVCSEDIWGMVLVPGYTLEEGPRVSWVDEQSREGTLNWTGQVWGWDVSFSDRETWVFILKFSVL